jgi:hypothetical protein
MHVLSVVEVEQGDPRLGLPTDLCQGFAIGVDLGTFQDNNIGAYLGLGAVELAIFDYFENVGFPNPYEGSTLGNFYNTAWLITPVNSTTVMPGVIADEVKYYVIQDPASTDPNNVAAGFVWGSPFMQSDIQNRDQLAIQLDVSHDIWSPIGGGPQIRAEATDGTHYGATSNPTPHVQDPGQDPLISCNWDCVFPPPVAGPVWPGGLCLCEIPAPNPTGGPFPAVLLIGVEANQTEVTFGPLPGIVQPDVTYPLPPGAIGLTTQPGLICYRPETWAEVLALRAPNVNSGGLAWNQNACPVGIVQIFPTIIENIGCEFTATGYDKGAWGFYFLCNNQPCGPDWIGWFFGIHLSKSDEVYPGKVQKLPLPGPLPTSKTR